MIRTSDTITLPRQSTHADGVDPDIAKGEGERAIFCYPGDVAKGVISCPWVAQTDVVMVKARVVLNATTGGLVNFHINDVIRDSFQLSGLNQEMAFTTPHLLRAGIDTLEVSFTTDCDGSATDMSVFVSFAKVDPI